MAEGQRLEERAAELLKSRGLTLAVAESCTGGLLSAMITSVAGSSEFFTGGVVAYSNEVKVALLNVSETTLADVGAVSARTAAEMAAGVRSRLGTDIGISITGVAGPGGGTPEKPVGTVFIGLSHPGADPSTMSVATRSYRFRGQRSEIRLSSAEAALETLITLLGGE